MLNNEKFPFFSIIVPTFNHAEYIEKSVSSIINQTFTNWELLLINNLSTDNTEEIINKFKDPKIKIFNINNAGVISKSRNLGIDNSKGKWIAFLDSDDWWDPKKLYECYKMIEPGIDFIYHDLWKFYNDSKIGEIKSRQLKAPIFMDLLLNGNPIAASSSVVRRSTFESIGGMNEELEMNSTADFNTWLKMAKVTDNFVYIPKKLGSYRIHDNNVSDNQIFGPTFKAVEEFLPSLSQSKRNKIIAKISYAQGVLSFKTGNSREALNYLKASFRFINTKQRIRVIWILFLIQINYQTKVNEGKSL